MLDDDPATELIVLVSKPPGPAGRGRGRGVRRPTLATPVLLALLGRRASRDLTAAARRRRRGAWAAPWPSRASWAGTAGAGAGGALRGLFAGGTLCDEAMLIAAADARRHPLQHPAATRAGRSAPTCGPTGT